MLEKIYDYGRLILSLVFFAKAIEGFLYKVPFPTWCGGTICRMRRSIYALLGDVAGSYYMAYLYFLTGAFLFYFAIKAIKNRDKNKK